MLRGIAVAIVVAGLCTTALAADRVSASEKGSVLVYPKVEAKWCFLDGQYRLVQDTYIDLNNDYFQDVHIVLFFVGEDCTVVYSDVDLTANEATYWRISDGLPKGVGPFSTTFPWPDPDGCDCFVWRGFVIAIATNAQNEQIRWNHLYGTATLLNWLYQYSWEYNSFAYKALDPAVNGEVVGTPGIVNFDGIEYEQCFDTLLMDFFAPNYPVYGCPPGQFPFPVPFTAVDTDLTLVVADWDLRQGGQPYTTKADFWIWNMNEASRRSHACITKWDQFLLSYDPVFRCNFLQTAKGRARIEGIQNTDCPDSTRRPLLGVRATFLMAGPEPNVCTAVRAAAGSNLFGSNFESAQLLYDVTPGPGEKSFMLGGATEPTALPKPLGIVR